jgi:hypothetical protein
MAIWSTVTAILLLTLIASSIGIWVWLTTCVSLLASYLSFIYLVGGLRSSDALGMAIGYGLMFMMPVTIATAVAIGLGRLIYGFLAKRNARPIALLRAQVGTPTPAGSVEDAIEQALRQFRSGSNVRVNCLNCERPISAKRILSKHSSVPDIELTCYCGTSSGIHPFYAAAS